MFYGVQMAYVYQHNGCQGFFTLYTPYKSTLELISGGGFRPSDKSITEYYRYLNAHKDYNPWFK